MHHDLIWLVHSCQIIRQSKQEKKNKHSTFQMYSIAAVTESHKRISIQNHVHNSVRWMRKRLMQMAMVVRWNLFRSE